MPALPTLRQLEEALDARLFERDRRNVWITAAGEGLDRRACGAAIRSCGCVCTRDAPRSWSRCCGAATSICWSSRSRLRSKDS